MQIFLASIQSISLFPQWWSTGLQAGNNGRKLHPSWLGPLIKGFLEKSIVSELLYTFRCPIGFWHYHTCQGCQEISTISHSAHYHTIHTVSHSIIEKERDRQSTMLALKRAIECKTFKPEEGKKKKEKIFKRIKKIESIDWEREKGWGKAKEKHYKLKLQNHMGWVNSNLFLLIFKKFIFNLHTVKFILWLNSYMSFDKCM